MLPALAYFARPAPAYGVQDYRGTFSDGATYLIQVPTKWNGTLVLYSHGYVPPNAPNPAYDVGDVATGGYLLAQGYALAGSSYAQVGWAVQQALPDQIEVLDTFASLIAQPKRTIAWGHSMGGLITAALIQQYPARFDAALPMCGAVSGGVGLWNGFLDTGFAFNTLLAGGQLQVVNIANPLTNYENAAAYLTTAQYSAQGRARIALAAALDDVPGWYQTGDAAPAPTDYADQETNQFLWFQDDLLYFDFAYRWELEGRAGGNPSWNAGVDYRRQLARSAQAPEVQALYLRAGLDLGVDLDTLNAAANITANPASLAYLSDNIILDGQISVPVFTMQTEGDGVVVNENESAYRAAVDGAGNGPLLQRSFVDRAGHCGFTPAETITAFETLVHRLKTGHWSSLTPAALNAVASALGSRYNSYPPAFAAFAPGPFLRTDNGIPPDGMKGRL